MSKEPQPLDSGTQPTEGEIRAHTVGELKPLSGGILIVDYNPQWPELFAREAERIRSVLGSLALRIEHAGSTAVPGLAAKPIIDLLLVVVDSAQEDAYAPARSGWLCAPHPRAQLVRAPYVQGPDTDINLHVFSSGCPEIDRMLMFRDWLRSNAADRDLYART